MVLKDFGKLVKLEIKQTKTGEVFEVMFNPESYSETFSNIYRKVENVNAGMEEYVYIKTLPQDFKLKMIIDGTGVSNYNSSFFPVLKNTEKSVYEKVNEFLKLAWYPEEGEAKPLRIKWGEFSYHCFLKEVVINYTLFDRKGHPLRAELDADFVSNPEKNEEEYKDRFNLRLKKKSDRTNGGNQKEDAKEESELTPNPEAQGGKTNNRIVISVS